MMKGKLLRLLAAAASGAFLLGGGCLGLGGYGDWVVRILQEELFG